MTEPGCLSFREVPHTTRLFADFLADFQRVQAFYPLSPNDTKGLRQRAGNLSYRSEIRDSVVAILEEQNRAWGASERTLKNIDRLRSGARAVVTGQQVVLFGGPVYSLYKALTAIRLADQLTRAGQDCVPIFWIATEDHDFAEINHANLRSPSGEMRAFFLTPTAEEGTPVGAVMLGQQINELIRDATSLLGAAAVSELLRHSYTPGETLGSAFAKLFTQIFGSYGLILLEPSHSEFHRLAEPLYAQSVADAGEISSALLERGKALESSGYHQQVKITNSSTLLFAAENGLRNPIRKVNGEFSFGSCRFTSVQLRERISAQPQDFSPNVLLRPIVQDYLLPTVAYIGGPSEVAYFAQASVVYEKLLGRATPILPRFSATLLDARAQRLLHRYRIHLKDLMRGPEQIRELLATCSLPQQLDSSFAAADENLEKSMAQLSQTLVQLDPTLRDAVQHATSKIRYQFERLRGRAAQAELRRNQELVQHANSLAASLYPNKNLQERELAGVSYLAQFGLELLPRLYDVIGSSCAGHHVIQL